MKRIRCVSIPILGFATLLGASGIAGCSPDEAASSPKLEGKKRDEIQKAKAGIPASKTPGGGKASP
jgi:hypothetical protein